MNKTILIDVDGTILDYSQELFNDYNMDKKSGEPILKLGELYKEGKKLKEFYSDDKYDGKGFYKNSKLFEQTIEFLKILKNNGFRIGLITSSMGGTGQKEFKVSLLKSIKELYVLLDDIVIDGTEYRKIITTNISKHKVRGECIIIDDKIGTIASSLHNGNSEAILISHNKNHQEINNEIEELGKKEIKKNMSYELKTLTEMIKKTNDKYCQATSYNDVLKFLKCKDLLPEQKKIKKNPNNSVIVKVKVSERRI